MIERLEFDTIYHEHLCYFSLTSLIPLFRRHGLVVVDVERLPIHGGSLQIHVARDGEPRASVCELLEEEARAGVGELAFYSNFQRKVMLLREELCDRLAKLKADGRSIAAYGASAKGATLLNYCGIGPETIDFVADRSTVKQGHYTPGAHLPVVPPEKLLEHRPDYVLLLTWNFADEILAQQHAYRERGGKFLIPIPEVRVV
jgi:hypothetical protein